MCANEAWGVTCALTKCFPPTPVAMIKTMRTAIHAKFAYLHMLEKGSDYGLTWVTLTGGSTHRFTALRPENDICPIKELVTREDIEVAFTNEKRDRRDKHDSDPNHGP